MGSAGPERPASDDWMPRVELLDLGIAVLPRDIGFYPERRATVFEFTWMREGAATAILNGEAIPMPPRGVMFIRPGDVVAYDYRPRTAAARILHAYVNFRLLSDHDVESWSRTRVMPADGYMLALLDHILRLDAERPEAWRVAARRSLEFVVGSFVTDNWETPREAEKGLPDVVLRALDTIMPAWLSGAALPAPTLTDLARSAGVSAEYLGRVFIREIGAPPVTTVRLIRLRWAARFLRLTTMSVGEIAHRSGFVSEFHFSRTFKAHTGLSPVVFRATPGATFELPPGVQRINGMF